MRMMCIILPSYIHPLVSNLISVSNTSSITPSKNFTLNCPAGLSLFSCICNSDGGDCMRYITFRLGVSHCHYSFNGTSKSDAVITALCGKRTRSVTSLTSSSFTPTPSLPLVNSYVMLSHYSFPSDPVGFSGDHRWQCDRSFTDGLPRLESVVERFLEFGVRK